jgi:hypothetical protein
MRREGLAGLDRAVEQAQEGVRHGEKRLAATLLPTWEGLSAPAQRVLALAAVLPAERVVLDWLRAAAQEEFADLGRDAEPGVPDAWLELVRQLLSLRLVQQSGEDGVVRMHRLVRAFVRGRQTPEDEVRDTSDLVRHVEARGRAILQGGDAHTAETTAVRALVEELARAGTDRWTQLVRCAWVYCGLAERVRGDPRTLDRIIARGRITPDEVDRLNQALDDDTDPVRRGAWLIAAAAVLYEASRPRADGAAELSLRTAAETFWERGRTLIGPGPVRGASGWRRHPDTDPLTTALLGVGYWRREVGPVEGGAPPQPPEPGAVPSPGPTGLPWFLRALARLGSVRVSLPTLLFSWLFSCMPLVALEDRLPGALLAASGLFLTGLALLLFALTALSHLIGPFLERRAEHIARWMSDLARVIGTDLEPEQRRAIVHQVVRFEYLLRQFPVRHTGAAAVAQIVRRGFSCFRDRPAEAARLTRQIAALDESAADALVAELAGFSNDQLRALFRALVRRWHLLLDNRLVIRMVVTTADRVPDPELLLRLLWQHRFFSAPGSPGIDALLSRAPAPFLARALLSCISRSTYDSWSARLGARVSGAAALVVGLILSQDEAKQRASITYTYILVQSFVALPFLLYFAFMFLCIGGAFGIAFGIPALLAYLAGRIHDPYSLARIPRHSDTGDWRRHLEIALDQHERGMAPLEVRRIQDVLYAQQILRGGPARLSDIPRRAAQRVIRALARSPLIGGLTEVLLKVMGDRQLLAVAGRGRPPAAGAPKPEDQNRLDRTQLARALPLRSYWRNGAWQAGLGLLGTGLWLALVAWWSTPERGNWIVPYGLAESVAVCLACVLAGHLYGLLVVYRPRASFWAEEIRGRRYRALVGLVLVGAFAWVHTQVEEAARAAGAPFPGLPGDAFHIPIIALVITNLLTPELIAQWRGAALLYPTAARLWRRRVLSALVWVACCALLALAAR